jgi:hypothetical protein
MTVEEIRKTPPAEMSTNAWLKEVAAQLAAMNERMARGPGRPAKAK